MKEWMIQELNMQRASYRRLEVDSARQASEKAERLSHVRYGDYQIESQRVDSLRNARTEATKLRGF